ncbi:hypothetical protein GPECTOR_26g496 [Gonium pectorale]|uniref:Tyrosine specific protein phosphatases domain-containing protein n=1 Tax=Gonium pectorale TaxID=33097 RepID=A0A150GFN1_GONPE|nr:hypothetical protein GPECTOR_26g496 [Gonium pectorale]|eukprot:KXZ48593.1 hypothetical protein GPECTOR_26g496 [Gonium pectorale]
MISSKSAVLAPAPRAAPLEPAPATADTATTDAATTSSSSNGSDPASEDAKKSESYSEDMQKKMGTTLTYRHELGLNYNRILPDIIVGSCLQTPADVDHLADKEGVRTVFCLQEDSDMAYFSLDVKPIQARCEERGDIKHVRFPIRDFDPFDLRRKLPKAVARLAREHKPSEGTIYIHCTAGLGRAPATALAYMFWLRGQKLDEAYELLRGKRMCSPRIEAIRSATVDLLVGTEPVMATIAVSRLGTTTDFKAGWGGRRLQWRGVAGLDVGWHVQLPLEPEKGTGRLVLRRMLQPGTYPYKFVVDGNWTYSADHPTIKDGNNINNILEVMGRSVPEHLAFAQQRLLAPGGDLTEQERAELRGMLCPWDSHRGVHPPGPEADGPDGFIVGEDWTDKLP